MPSQYEHGPDFQTPNEAEISRLSSENADLRRIDDAMVERALVKWWQIDHISEGGDPEFILLSMRDMRQALEAALKVPDETKLDPLALFHKAWGYAHEHSTEIAGGYDKAAFGHVQFWLSKVQR
jgi:hypothetical protein